MLRYLQVKDPSRFQKVVRIKLVLNLGLLLFKGVQFDPVKNKSRLFFRETFISLGHCACIEPYNENAL